MIIDRTLRFSASQALAGTTATVSTDALDLGGMGLAGAQPIGRPLYVRVQIEAFAGTAPTLAVTVQTDDTGAFSSPQAVLANPALPMAANRRLLLPVPRLKRYVRLLFTQGGTSPTSTVSAWLTDEP